MAFFNAADPGQLIYSFRHVEYVDGLTEVVVDLHQTEEADGTEAKIVANIGHKSHDFSFVWALAGRQVTTAWSTDRNLILLVVHIRNADDL